MRNNNRQLTRILGKFCMVGIFFLFAQPCFAASEQSSELGGHGAELAWLMIGLMIIGIAGRLGADLAVRLGQPEVLGELMFGIVLGNLTIMGLDWFEFLKIDHTLDVLSQLGVVFLLFQVGLETDLKEMTQVGWSALIVAVLGVIAPSILGFGVATLFDTEGNAISHIFVGATLCATSVGITARVFKELGVISTKESRIVLGAAVIDDVLGLLVLSLVTGMVTSIDKGTTVNFMEIVRIIFVSFSFLCGSILVGRLFVPYGLRIAIFLRSHGVLLISALTLCLAFSSMAALAGLAPIVGAFAAGLVLDPIHYQHLEEKEDGASLEQMLKPLITLFTPIFFVMIGLRVDVTHFTSWSVMLYAIIMTMAAVLGKQVCGLGVLEKGVNRIIVGFGMIPRGEVGLIFAAQGALLSINGEKVINPSTYGAVIFMVLATTMVTPFLLSWKLRGKNSREIG